MVSGKRNLYFISKFAICFIISITNTFATADITPNNIIDLSGKWDFQLDGSNAGIQEEWYSKKPEQTIQLPGTTDMAGFGELNTSRETYYLTRKYKYIGVAWYQRQVEIPRRWSGKNITLLLERCLWQSQLWIDDKHAGMRDSLSTAHIYDLGKLKAGKHTLTIRVDNTRQHNLGSTHAYSRQIQSIWNGIIGKIELVAKDPVSISDVQVHPDIESGTAKVKIKIENHTGKFIQGKINLSASFSGKQQAAADSDFNAPSGLSEVNITLHMGGDFKLWDEFSPNLYNLKTVLETEEYADTQNVTFGMRNFSANGKQFSLNGRAIFLRGTHDSGGFPLTGYPSMEVDDWKRIFSIMKSYGLNHSRFHSWCPGEAAFVAADEMGIMLQPEAPLNGTRVGTDADTLKYITSEIDRILDAYGNHPSFVMFSNGNELGGDHDEMRKWVRQGQDKDPRHLYTYGSNSPWHAAPVPGAGDPEDFYVAYTVGKFGSGPWLRGAYHLPSYGHMNNWPPSTNVDYNKSLDGIGVPTVTHEVGQYLAFPNFDEIVKYTGVLEARNFEVFREDLASHNMLDQADDFFKASGALQVLLYKEEIEAALRTDGYAGFRLLDIRDYSGQGTALVGVLDAFWDSKGFVQPENFRQFCNSTVPLMRTGKLTWTSEETFAADVQVCHFGAHSIKNAVVKWSVSDTENKVVGKGEFPAGNIPTGKLSDIGDFQLPLNNLRSPAKYTVKVEIEDSTFENTWDIWVYPAKVGTNIPDDIFVTDSWNDETKTALQQGRKVFLMPCEDQGFPYIVGSFTSNFWTYPMFKHYKPAGTLGLLCDPSHPALAKFPTEYHSTWQWWDLNNNSKVMVLDTTPADFRPIVQIIDNPSRNHKLGSVFEAYVGKGRLLVTTIDLRTDLEKRPAARQLLHSLVSYASSDKFKPANKLTSQQIDKLFTPQTGSDADMNKKFERGAKLWVKAGQYLKNKRSASWDGRLDKIKVKEKGFGYSVDGEVINADNVSAWFAPKSPLRFKVTCPRGFNGQLFMRFEDIEGKVPSAEIFFQGELAARVDKYEKDGFWVGLYTAQNALEGVLDIEVVNKGNAKMFITEIVLVK